MLVSNFRNISTEKSLSNIFGNPRLTIFLMDLINNSTIKNHVFVSYFGCRGIEFKLNGGIVGVFLDNGYYRLDVLSARERFWCKNLHELRGVLNLLINR